MPIKTIIGALDLTELTADKAELFTYIDEEVASCIANGDCLGAGEWLANKIVHADADQIEELFARVITLWASPQRVPVPATSVKELLAREGEFQGEDLALAAVYAVAYLRSHNKDLPASAGNLSYRLATSVSRLFELRDSRPQEAINQCVPRLDALTRDLQLAVRSFCQTNCVTAKRVSLDVVRKERQLKRLVLPQERPMVSHLDALLGPTFRRFCESYEQNNARELISSADDLAQQARELSNVSGRQLSSTFWHLVIKPIASHVSRLIEEGSRRSEIATAPSLKLATGVQKADLAKVNSQIRVLCRLSNRGQGRASQVRVAAELPKSVMELELLDPLGPFELDGSSGE